MAPSTSRSNYRDPRNETVGWNLQPDYSPVSTFPISKDFAPRVIPITKPCKTSHLIYLPSKTNRLLQVQLIEQIAPTKENIVKKLAPYLALFAFSVACANTTQPSDWIVDGGAGSTATAGVSGSAGSAGVSGSAGSAGAAGSAGSAGVSGSAGSAGVAGSAGSAGAAGTTGTAGTGGSVVCTGITSWDTVAVPHVTLGSNNKVIQDNVLYQYDGDKPSEVGYVNCPPNGMGEVWCWSGENTHCYTNLGNCP